MRFCKHFSSLAVPQGRQGPSALPGTEPRSGPGWRWLHQTRDEDEGHELKPALPPATLSDADHGLTLFPTFSLFLGRGFPGLLPRWGQSPGGAPSADSWLHSVSDSFKYTTRGTNLSFQPFTGWNSCVPWHPLPQQTVILKWVGAPILATTVQLSGKIFLGRLIQKFFSSDNFNSKCVIAYLSFTVFHKKCAWKRVVLADVIAV